jgi:hypothetical protein
MKNIILYRFPEESGSFGFSGSTNPRGGIMSRIKALTSEQEALLSVYREKWQRLAFKTGAIDQEQATIALQAAYRAIGKPVPPICFFESRSTAFQAFRASIPKSAQWLWRILFWNPGNLELWVVLGIIGVIIQCILFLPAAVWGLVNVMGWHTLAALLEPLAAWGSIGGCALMFLFLPTQWAFAITYRFLKPRIINLLEFQLHHPLKRSLSAQLFAQVEKQVSRSVSMQVWQAAYPEATALEVFYCHLHHLCKSSPEYWARVTFYRNSWTERDYQTGSWLDFCISVLGCRHDAKKWRIFQALVEHCGCITASYHQCLVCDNPLQIRLDENALLHAEAAPAFETADGSQVYAYHGSLIPETYGAIHPSQWKAEWLLQEDNTTLRRVLIQAIGYEKIAQDLQAIAIDSWQEYTLLKIDAEVDVEPIYLLKMSCPSTGDIHVLRIPPTLQTAREAICWVNWDTDAEAFAAQT